MSESEGPYGAWGPLQPGYPSAVWNLEILTMECSEARGHVFCQAWTDHFWLQFNRQHFKRKTKQFCMAPKKIPINEQESHLSVLIAFKLEISLEYVLLFIIDNNTR